MMSAVPLGVKGEKLPFDGVDLGLQGVALGSLGLTRVTDGWSSITSKGYGQMNRLLRLEFAVPALLFALMMALTVPAQAVCSNWEPTCSGARTKCYANLKKYAGGKNLERCEGWYSQCMSTGRWDTDTCKRGGLKRQ
jgi:hypothetical protein